MMKSAGLCGTMFTLKWQNSMITDDFEKICNGCKKLQSIYNFSGCRKNADGFNHKCRDCDKARYFRDKEKNKEKMVLYGKEYWKNNKDFVNIRREARKEERVEYDREYHIKNKDKKRTQKGILFKRKMKEDIQFRLATNLRYRLYQAIKNEYKAGSAVRDLGCSIEFLKQYLENKFESWMNWNNWGNGENKWNIDHITPLSSFDLQDRDEFLKAVHYSNLQPLRAVDNIRKGNKVA